MNAPTVTSLENRPAQSGGGFRSVLTLLFLIPWTIFWGAWSMLFGLLNARVCIRRGLQVWSGGILRVAGISVEVRGSALLIPDQRYVFLVNHQSAMDIPILLKVIMATRDVRFMAKESLFKIPFLGWGMRLSGFVPIRRESPRHAAETFKKLLESESMQNQSFIIFPEGTRSDDGRLQPFKKGTLAMALRLRLPIVPVTLIDACRANPKGSFAVRSGTVHVVFHEPIEIAADQTERRTVRDDLVRRVHAVVASALPQDQQPTGEPAAADESAE